MTGIERVGPTNIARIRAFTGMRPAQGFSVPEEGGEPAPVAGPLAMTGLIAPLETDSEDEAPARQRASALLFELATLQRSMLGDGDPVSILRRLDGMLDGGPAHASPPLLALLSAVRLRARVELARRAWGANR
jgi:hypothetical protein